MKIIKRALLIILAGLVIIILALVIKTIRFSSKQLKNVVKAAEIVVDINRINENLSNAIQFQTISHPDTAKVNGKEFLALHDYLGDFCRIAIGFCRYLVSGDRHRFRHELSNAQGRRTIVRLRRRRTVVIVE